MLQGKHVLKISLTASDGQQGFCAFHASFRQLLCHNAKKMGIEAALVLNH